MAAGDAADIASRGLRLSRRDPDRATDAAEGLEWLNECHRSILTDGTPWTFLTSVHDLTLTAGTLTYAFSAIKTAISYTGTIERIEVIATEAGDVLKGMDLRQLERLAGGTLGTSEHTGHPVAYVQVGLGTSDPVLHVWPVPDRDVEARVTVRAAVTDLTGVDFPLIPGAHASAVLSSYVAARMWDQQSGGDAANESMRQDTRHERALRRLIDAYGSGRQEDIVFAEPTLYEHLDSPGRSW